MTAPTRPSTAMPVLPAALIAAAFEGVIAVAASRGAIGLGLWLALHTAMILALSAFAYHGRNRQGDQGLPALLALATAVAGPFGALGAIYLALLNPDAEDAALLARWYERISLSVETDDVARLSNHVSIGRALDLGSPAPHSMVAVIDQGTIEEKQAILGLISRRFHPDYLPALKQALISPEPVIRVQAAAVAARVRGKLGSKVGDLFATASNRDTATATRVAALGEIRRCLESRLMEERERGAFASRLADLERDVVSASLDKPAMAALTADPDARAEIEAALLQQRRYADLRALRRTLQWHRLGRFRYRPWTRTKHAPRPLANVTHRLRRERGRA